MHKKMGVGLVLVGMVLGCGAAATLPASFAEPAAGEWACYNATFFDRNFSAEAAAKAAEKVTKGMNVVARHVPAGATLSTLESIVCVKH